jgi:hypothetical protein
MRMDERDAAKKVLCTEPGGTGNRKRGRPKLRWCDEVEKDVARAGCRNYRLTAQSKEKWRKLVEEVKSRPRT